MQIDFFEHELNPRLLRETSVNITIHLQGNSNKSLFTIGGQKGRKKFTFQTNIESYFVVIAYIQEVFLFEHELSPRLLKETSVNITLHLQGNANKSLFTIGGQKGRKKIHVSNKY
jgi:hypothetical protein